MHQACQEQDAEFIVVVIPTKEFVFEKSIQDNLDAMRFAEELVKIIENEKITRKMLFDHFAESGIPFIDTVDHLRDQIGRRQMYTRSAVDLHPNRNGYEVIGEAVSRYLLDHSADENAQKKANP